MPTHAHTLNAGNTRKFALVATAALSLALVGCTTASAPGTAADGDSDSSDSGSNGGANGGGTKVTLVVHNSFPNDEFAEAASAATGYDVEVVSAGDGGELSSQLILTSSAPIGDAFFGIDNVFASRIVEGGVTEPYLPEAVPARAEQHLYVAQGSIVPIDLGATCINIDPAWFAAEGIAEPTSYEDLASDTYRGLTVLLDPSTSSTGASFLIGTVAEFGEDGFGDYWSELADNEVRIENGWSEAYYGHFTQGGGEGTYPIVLSYSSSPAWTLTEDGSATTTKALLDTCSSQIEYAGVLQGAANPEGARAVIDFMLSSEFQDTIADTMYVYPIDESAYVPTEWEQFAPLPNAPRDLSPAEIGASRDGWLKTWSDATGW